MKQTINRTPAAAALLAAGVVGLAAAIAAQGTAKVPGNIWPPAKKQMAKSIADGIAAAMRPSLLGDPARIATSTQVDTGGGELASVTIRVTK